MAHPTFAFKDKRLPHHLITNVDGIIAFIERNMPSFANRIPAEWTEAVVDRLFMDGVSPLIIVQVLHKERKRGFDFMPTLRTIQWGYDDKYRPPYPGKIQPLRQQRDSDRSFAALKLSIQDLETKFRMAESAQMYDEMAQLIIAALSLAWAYAQAYGEAKQKAHELSEHEHDWTGWDKEAFEAFTGAHRLNSHIRYLSRNELEQLRTMPRPEAMQRMRIRLNTTRAPARRAPRR